MNIINKNEAGINSIPNIPNMSQAVDIMCDECGCKLFEEKIMLKKISKFLSGSDKDSITPIPVVACANCNHVNEMFMPKL